MWGWCPDAGGGCRVRPRHPGPLPLRPGAADATIEGRHSRHGESCQEAGMHRSIQGLSEPVRPAGTGTGRRTTGRV